MHTPDQAVLPGTPLRPAGTRHGLSRRRLRGMTLVELMVVIVVLGVLLALAYPSYLSSVRKARRADGISALNTIQQAQERYRANNATYGTLAQLQAALGVSATSSSGHYTLAVSNNDEIRYTITATAAGSQAQDSNCKLVGVQVVRGTLTYGSASAAIDWAAADPDAGKCWAK